MAENPSHDQTLAALARHDARLADRGLEIWIGAEPTFTDRFSISPEWQNQALGGEKEARALRLTEALARGLPGCAVMRSLGRQYQGEPARRWSYGLLSHRDATGLWHGPPDPLMGGGESDTATLQRLTANIWARLPAIGWSGQRFEGRRPHEQRILFATSGQAPTIDPQDDERCFCPSLHLTPGDQDGARDSLASQGLLLLIGCLLEEDDRRYAALELPALGDAGQFVELLAVIAGAAIQARLAGLILRGHPPPLAQWLRWTTVTPDPGVVEINQAPAAGTRELLIENRRLYAAAAAQSLSAYRLHYNGQSDDSGGAGQLSIGGPIAERSPFALAPHLLPALVRYLNRHPALSYWFAPQYVGAFSQAPRPDEGIPDLFDELGLTLGYLATQPAANPELLWRSLNPFLRDVSGNAHRSELNIEKLWRPFQQTGAVAGIVEFRAFRMARSPEHMAATAALLRGLVAMLMTHPFDGPLVHWGRQLHERFALPFFLEQDLDQVLADLTDTGFELAPQLVEYLRDDGGRRIAQAPCAEDRLVVSTALEFWPQVGDTMAQPADSRLVDASTGRLEIRVESRDEGRLRDWQLVVSGYRVPLRLELGRHGPVGVAGVRYRRFASAHALHPGIEPRLPLHLQLYNAPAATGVDGYFHEWRPDAAAYPGLPADEEEAAARRAARFVFREMASPDAPASSTPPPDSLTDYGFDLRWT
jgi:uncharacterized protein (DUF2126 family)